MFANKSMHGTTKAVGCDHMGLGHFCRLEPSQRTWAQDAQVTDKVQAAEVAMALGGLGGPMHDADNLSPDSDIPALYTFLGQFVDHDISLDTTTKLDGDPLGDDEIRDLPNLRSASLDLDCVYGTGPEAMPFMYDPCDHLYLLTGSVVDGVRNDYDLPRTREGRALIGDPRNDENLFVSQLQHMFLRLHNRLVSTRTFEEAQRQTRYHYQWVVLHDFLQRVCDPTVYQVAVAKMLAAVDEDPAVRAQAGDHFRQLDAHGNTCLPVEFSVAAYRFGHTMVRSSYPVNDIYPDIELFDERFGTLGFGPVPPELVVDFSQILDLDPQRPPVCSKALDHLLADELIRMPNPIVGSRASANERSLAFRNLQRGYVLGLPSGQRVARYLRDSGLYPLINPAQNLKLVDESQDPQGIRGWDQATQGLGCRLGHHTPLFFYLLREAGVIGGGMHLGPVGSAILMEVFGTMLVRCETSFLKARDQDGQRVVWTPLPEVTGGAANLTLAHLVRCALR